MSATPDPQLIQLLQQQLRDVHSPEAIGWCPLATAWWVLLILMIGLISAGTLYLIRKFLRNRYRNAALDELKLSFEQWQIDGNNADYLQRSNTIIKRVFLHLERENPEYSGSVLSAGLSGNTWANKVNSVVKKPLCESTIHALVNQCYQAEPHANIEAIQGELRGWLKSHQHSRSPSINEAARGHHA